MINLILIQVRYSVVSGFIFLRFFAPAILGPKLFDLTAEPLVSFSLISCYTRVLATSAQDVGNASSSGCLSLCLLRKHISPWMNEFSKKRTIEQCESAENENVFFRWTNVKFAMALVNQKLFEDFNERKQI